MNVTDSVVVLLMKRCACLVSLNVSYTIFSGNFFFQHSVHTHLQTLNVCGCIHFNKKNIEQIKISCPKLINFVYSDVMSFLDTLNQQQMLLEQQKQQRIQQQLLSQQDLGMIIVFNSGNK